MDIQKLKENNGILRNPKTIKMDGQKLKES